MVRDGSLGRAARYLRHRQGHHLCLRAAWPLRHDTGRIADHFEDHFFAHGHTYEAHPMTLAPAIATIREIQRLNLVQRSREMGEYLGQQLRTPGRPTIRALATCAAWVCFGRSSS